MKPTSQLAFPPLPCTHQCDAGVPVAVNGAAAHPDTSATTMTTINLFNVKIVFIIASAKDRRRPTLLACFCSPNGRVVVKNYCADLGGGTSGA